MKRRDRSIEIISLSAIDLFASALGAFIIITAILIPYYPNMKDGGKDVEILQQQIESSRLATEASLEAARKAKEDEKRKRAQLEEAKKSEQWKRKTLAEIQQATAKNKALEKTITDLTRTLAKLKKRNKAQRKQSASGDTDFSLLGITTQAKSIVIVVDLSGSMKSWGHVMVETLTEIISPFNEKIKFAILGYQGRLGVSQYWPRRKQMALGDAGSKATALRFAQRLQYQFNGGTPTQTALLTALSYRPEAIILISDGAPTDSKPSGIIEKVTRLNGGRSEIHTVALGDYFRHSKFVLFLSELSKRNDGQFVGVIR
jgi:von Willebrand factor type A domain